MTTEAITCRPFAHGLESGPTALMFCTDYCGLPGFNDVVLAAKGLQGVLDALFACVCTCGLSLPNVYVPVATLLILDMPKDVNRPDPDTRLMLPDLFSDEPIDVAHCNGSSCHSRLLLFLAILA